VILYISPAVRDMLGFDSTEIIGKNFTELVYKDDLSRLEKWYSELRKGRESPSEYRIIDKSGEPRWTQTRVRPIMEDNQFRGARGILLDVTKQKQAEEALNKAKTLLDKTFSSIEEAIIIVDSNTRRIIACNHATEVIFGFGEKDLIGCSTDVLHVDKLSYELFGQELFPALDANGVFRTEFQMRRKDGSVFPTENTVTEILDDLGHRTSVVSLVRDITDRRMAAKKLKQTNIFLDSIIENIPNMIFLKNARDLRFIRLNRAGEDLLGYSRDNLLGKSDYDFFPKEQADHFTKKDREVLNGKEVVDIPEESLQTRTKGERIVHTKKVPLLDEKGEPEFLLGISEDITERNKMDEKLRQRDIQLKKLTSWAPGMMYQFTKRTDGTLCVPFTTEAVKDIFGCSPEDIREDYSPIARVILPEDLDKVIDSIEYSAKHLTIWALEYRVQIPGQSIRWILGKSTPEKLADGSITWYGFNTDITETKKAEEALRHEKILYEDLVTTQPSGVYRLRVKFRGDWQAEKWRSMMESTYSVDMASDRYCNILGISHEEFVANPGVVPDRIHPDDKQDFNAKNAQAMTSLSPFTWEGRITRHHQTRWVHLESIPRVLDSETVLWTGIVYDITDRKRTEEHLQQTLGSLRKAVATTIQVMVSAVEARDPYTAGHQVRVADLARAIATEMGLPQEQINGIHMAGTIHDLGKLSIPAEILSKPTKLSENEFSLIKEHSRGGYEILKNVESPWPLAQIVYQHHERMDGSGYPRNLKGNDILIEARIMAVADVVESMASHRPYRPAIGIEAALEEIEKNKGILYDDAVADACLRLFREKGFQLLS